MVIYALKDNDNFFYVGKTVNIAKRIKGHLGDKRPSIKDDIVRAILRNGRCLDYEILKECSDNIEAIVWEKYFVSKLISEGHKLTNVWLSTEQDYIILQCLADDMQSKDIAIKCNMSNRTMETRIGKIKKKYNCKTLGGLMYHCYKLGLVN